jgi:hypothetical protein
MCRVRAHAKLIEVRLPSHNGPCIFEKFDYCGIERAREAPQDSRGASRQEVGCADVVFHGNELPINGGQLSP